MDQILATKLYIPPSRQELVSRPRLIKRLDAGLSRKMTLISAPAGFGKTTLASEWVGHLRLDGSGNGQNELSIAWLSLDESDSDPARFLAYFIVCLNRIAGNEGTLGERALAMVQSSQPPPTEVILTSLINEVANYPEGIVLVLDDYHSIESSPIDDALAFFLEHLPPQVHLVIATRVDPPLPLARLRARGQLTELRAADLRFSSSEVAEFLNQINGLNLSVENIAALESRTEGWIAGLQLAAISMQGRQDAAALIETFTSSHRFVLDYLVEEVFERQPENIQTFLLKTSILTRLNSPLCDILTGQENSQGTLETLVAANLFIVPLDEERLWFRYHHLFASLLQKRLVQSHPEQILRLHNLASQWYEENGYFDEAIQHAIRGEDFEHAAHLIEKNVDISWERGEHAKLRRWLIKLPVDLVTARPYLCIFHAWYRFASGQYDAAEESLYAVEQALGSMRHPPDNTGPQVHSITGSDRSRLRGKLAAIRAFMDTHRGDVPGMIQHANVALEYLPEQDLNWRSLVALVLGDVHGFKGDMAAAYEARLHALKACEAAGEIYYIMLASLKLAITLRSQGRLRRTMEICQQQIQLASECGLSQTSLTGLLMAIMGEVLAERNDLDSAWHQVKTGVKLVEQGIDMVMRGWGYQCLLRVLYSRQDQAGIEELIQKVENIARTSNVPDWVMNQITVWQARLWLSKDNLEAASQWAHERSLTIDPEHKPQQEIDYFSLFDYLVLARIMLAKGQLEEASELLHNLLTAAETMGRTARVIEIRILQALSAHAMGDDNLALQALEQALYLAEAEGFCRIFVDEGPPMARLLYQALSGEVAPDYARRLLAAFPTVEREQTGSLPARVRISELLEPLTEREVEVLRLIAEGLTNREIANRLYLSLNTIKVHTRNIYGKLGVNNRTSAGKRARLLGILPPV